jgi:hypothetical protein
MHIDTVFSLEKEKLLSRIGKRFDVLMKGTGYTSTNKFADAYKFSRSRIFELKRGKLNVTIWTLFTTCEGLDISLDEFFKDL